MAWISGNFALNQSQMDNNAKEVYNFFSSRGFTLNAIAGMLGNMWRESTVNPGVWQSYKVNYNMGYGLVQWTPATKVIDWCKQNGYAMDDGYAQCLRIIWEKENHTQYYPTGSYPESFNAFAESTKSVEYLVRAFFANYERGSIADAAMTDRIKWGNYFYQLLSGGETPPEPEPDPDVPKPPDPAPKPQRGDIRKRMMMITSRKRKE